LRIEIILDPPAGGEMEWSSTWKRECCNTSVKLCYRSVWHSRKSNL